MGGFKKMCWTLHQAPMRGPIFWRKNLYFDDFPFWREIFGQVDWKGREDYYWYFQKLRYWYPYQHKHFQKSVDTSIIDMAYRCIQLGAAHFLGDFILQCNKLYPNPMISRTNHFQFTSWIKLLLNNRQGHQRRERMESKEWNTKKATRGGFMWNKCDKCCK